jgi:hypothetical protein
MNHRIIVGVLAAIAFAIPASPVGASVQRDTAAVRAFSDTSVVGWSTLQRHPDSIQMSLHTSDLPAGHVVTVWWIIFNHPEFCQFGEPANPATGFAGTKCGPGDLGIVPGLTADPRVDPSVVHAAGHVIGSTGVGDFAGYLSVGATRSQVLLGGGLTNPLGADVHLLVHSHDAAVGDGALGPEVNSFGATAGADLQFSAHEAT